MKIFRKITTGVLALTLCTGMASINVGATGSTYLKGDVDGDGQVGLVDLAYLQQFLNGSKSGNSLCAERLDVNRDNIIDIRDRILLSNIIANSSGSESLQYEGDNSLPAQESRIYYKYNPNTGSFNGFYTVSTVSNIQSSQTSTMNIINTDDRQPESQLPGVVAITSSTNSLVGTAFIVDSHTILTAASSIFSSNKVICNLNYKICSNINNTSEITITPKKYHIPSGYVLNTTEKYNYAIITVEEDLSDYVEFNLGVMKDELSSTQRIYATGFSHNDYNGNSSLKNKKVTSSGYLLPNYYSTDGNVIAYNADTSYASQGCPIYIDDNGIKTVIGINTTNYITLGPDVDKNTGLRITTNILNAIYNNSHLSD